MAVPNDIRIHEVTFCGRVMKWAEAIFRDNPDLPFRRVEIEESKGIKRKRSDLRIYDGNKKLLLAGEVKLPGTAEGRNPYDSSLIEDAFLKASNAGAQFFFTWNVNKLVLFDSSLWQKPLYERRVKDYDLGEELQSPDDLTRQEVEDAIQKFLAIFLLDFAHIVTGERDDWGMAPDELFIRAFECHISWAVKITSEFLFSKAASDKGFDVQLQEWMAKDQGWMIVRGDPAYWRLMIDRAARTLCYVFSNRLIFYESVRVKFDTLKELSIPKRLQEPVHLYAHFQNVFKKAIDVTGDYETLFYPYESDWGGLNVFGHKDSADAWRSVLENLRPFNFKGIRSDILGAIFQRLIAPEERHKFGQHYTHEDIVDVINAFCIRRADSVVLDPACGSGSFLVRAYHRKALLDPSMSHQQRITQIYGSDIALFAAHLATLNIAARDINEEENYPRIARKNFFEVSKDKPFCLLPSGLRDDRRIEAVFVPDLDAVVGNPPYVRQELIPKRSAKNLKPMQAKEDLQELCARLWPGLKLGGRSDLHCYFWPAATAFLKDDGWFGFIVSSSWLDVEYGFALQEWALRHFKIHAIIETQAEPWFEDARVKTCAVILQRCDDEAERFAQLVKFVALKVPLAEILGTREDEHSRQKAAEFLRDLITRTKENKATDSYRIIVKRQHDLWEEGLRAGQLFAMQKLRVTNGAEDDDDEEGESPDNGGSATVMEMPEMGYVRQYGGGKWGKFLRAPDLYFEIMERLGKRFVRLGEIASIKRGITSGCDDFFMPRDVTAKFLAKYVTPREWNDAPILSPCKRSEAESGAVKLVEAGDGTIHAIESEYLAPEVHSLMKIQRPVIVPEELDRLILLVSAPIAELKGKHVHRYLRYGERSTFASKKSKAVPVPQRATCASRERWYDLTYTTAGHLIWPKSQQYRHVVVDNSNRVIVNCNLYDVTVSDPACNSSLLVAVLNSTLVALTKIYFGRYAGTEGNLKTEVVDVNLLDVPDPRQAAPDVAAKLRAAFERLCQRDTRPMVEEALMECRSPEIAKKLAEQPIALPSELTMPDRRDLDLAVFEMLGVANPDERNRLCNQLYYETASHFRQVRIVEIQKQEQRAGGGRDFGIQELAFDLWHALTDDERQPLAQWYAGLAGNGTDVVIPDGDPVLPSADDMLDANTVFFRAKNLVRGATPALQFKYRSQAELAYLLASHGIKGTALIPDDQSEAGSVLSDLLERLAFIEHRSEQLSKSRTNDEARVAELANLLRHWMLHGKG